jgi:hypothetical protein
MNVIDLLVKAEQQNELETLRNLVSLNESLKSQEADFKANCKRQLADLQVDTNGFVLSAILGHALCRHGFGARKRKLQAMMMKAEGLQKWRRCTPK